MVKPFVKKGFTHIVGRSQESAQKLLEAAKEAGFEGEVSTTSIGYIVRDEIVEFLNKAPKETEEEKQEEQTQEETPTLVPVEPGENDVQLFNPADHNAPEVIEYLKGADEVEAARVLSLEAEGQKRATVLNKGDK